MTEPALIAVDWGTTACRAALVSRDGAVLQSRDDGRGILAVKDRQFEQALAELIAPWRGQRVPIILAGMIGSRQGWVEAPYLSCPAGLAEVATNLTWIEADQFGRIALVPGLSTRNGAMPDVMRGEETQIFGALGDKSGIAVLPGTHSKWATVETGRIAGFRSYMTGEVFAALKDHTILGRLMMPATQPDDRAFTRGVRDGAASGGPGALLNRIFAARTLSLFDDLPPTALADYLSGLLLGSEIADNTIDTPITFIGSAALTASYGLAATALGRTFITARTDSAPHGAWRIARAAGLLGDPS